MIPFYTSSTQQQTQKEHTRSGSVSLDPENRLHVDVSVDFRATLNQFDYVFNPKIEGRTGASGTFEAEVNMCSVETPLPPTSLGNVDYPNTCMTDS